MLWLLQLIGCCPAGCLLAGVVSEQGGAENLPKPPPMLALSTISLLLPAAAAVVGPSPRAMEMELQFQCEHDAEMATSRELIASGNAPLDLVMLTDAQGKDKGAVCLDGTNPGFYMTKGSGDGVDKWVLCKRSPARSSLAQAAGPLRPHFHASHPSHGRRARGA